MPMNRQILLAKRPQGGVAPDNFQLVDAPLPRLEPGQVLVRNHYLSLDPYMRGRMSDKESYAPPQPLGAVMIGGTAGEVIESRNATYRVGDNVVGMFGWQQYGVSDGTGLRKVDATRAPLSAYLGALGMPGVTAWYGLNRIIAPRAGETVALSAASGAVGSVVGQLAAQRGCRVVGIAGGPEKCRYLVDELGFDAAVDYKAGALHRDLAAAAPHGIDGYFENVGGEILDAALARMNAFGRIALCGMIAGYDGGTPLPLRHPARLLVARLLLQGFIITEHMDVWPAALDELAELLAQGKLRFRESIAQGLEQAPEAFIGLLKGRNFGKQLVKLI